MDKKNIGDTYNEYAEVQKNCFFTLLEFLLENSDKKIDKVLDLGCGNGTNTVLLQKEFGVKAIVGIDKSSEMIEYAQNSYEKNGINFLTKKIEDLAFDSEFDLIFSNATMQWVEDMSGSIIRLKSALKDKGVLAFSVFGPETYKELKTALSKCLDRDVRLQSDFFMDFDSMGQILKHCFVNVETKEKIVEKRYASISALFESIKFTGTTGKNNLNGVFWTPGLLKRVEEEYMQKYNNISVTYQLGYFLCSGNKISKSIKEV
jgi:malonyl-CoA O-methyltransferase